MPQIRAQCHIACGTGKHVDDDDSDDDDDGDDDNDDDNDHEDEDDDHDHDHDDDDDDVDECDDDGVYDSDKLLAPHPPITATVSRATNSNNNNKDDASMPRCLPNGASPVCLSTMPAA